MHLRVVEISSIEGTANVDADLSTVRTDMHAMWAGMIVTLGVFRYVAFMYIPQNSQTAVAGTKILGKKEY